MEVSETREFDWWNRHENHVTSGAPVRFDLFVRSLGPPSGSHGRQASILDRVDRLDRRDDVDGADVTVWGESVCVSECCAKHGAVRSLLDRIERFRKWGQETRGVSIDFDPREVDSSLTGECFEVIDLPTICLAVSVEARLEGVFPITVGGREWTIESYLDWFEQTRDRTDATMLVDA